MRSRYTAYALGGYGEYLFSTWHNANDKGLSAAQLASRSSDWLRLEVLTKSQIGNHAEVEFKAYYSDEDKSTECHHERSSFIRIDGRWYYEEGSIL